MLHMVSLSIISNAYLYAVSTMCIRHSIELNMLTPKDTPMLNFVELFSVLHFFYPRVVNVFFQHWNLSFPSLFAFIVFEFGVFNLTILIREIER